MEEPPQYYQPPANHGAHYKKMYVWLGSFFGVLGVIILLCVIFANPLARALPFAVEKRFVRPYEAMASRWFSDQLGDPAIESYLEELVFELAEVMEVPKDYELSVHYVDSMEANAFATLGGHIFVLRGLLDSVPDENSLTMILAHELSHIKNRDPLASMGRGVAFQMMLSYFTGNSQHTQNLGSLGGQLGLLSYSREQEARSDIEALHALNAYYGHVTGFDAFFRKMMDEHMDADGTPAWFQSHPDLKDRIAALETEISESAYAQKEAVAFPDWFTKKLTEPPASFDELTDAESR